MSEEKKDELDLLVGRMRSAAAPLRGTLNRLYEQFRDVRDGKVADYIPELAKANPDWFGISMVTAQGQAFDVGDASVKFSIQSASKPFVFGLALEDHGLEGVMNKVGVEPTGEAFNAIVLDEVSNRPFNPMVNAGAIATADLVKGADYPERVGRMLDMFARYVGHEVFVDTKVFMSERVTGHRNRAIGHLMRNFGMVGENFEESLELYFQQCSILVTCRDLAMIGATLANGGINPVTGVRAIDAQYVKYLLSVMLSCGMYDYAGEWAFRVGIPAKSGVGGGIVAVVPGKLGIGVFSPCLDLKGNSVRGVKVCSELSHMFGLHAFELDRNHQSLDEQLLPQRSR
ncbi:MAG: glutaminase A [Planctomycetes bacterium]|nr:glutaminase A [Planctomycetota bacterium]